MTRRALSINELTPQRGEYFCRCCYCQHYFADRNKRAVVCPACAKERKQ